MRLRFNSLLILISFFFFSGFIISAEKEAVSHTIVYLGKKYEEPPPLSLLEKILIDEGVQGSRLALKNTNLTGRLLNTEFNLIEKKLELNESPKDAFINFINSGYKYFILDLNAEDILGITSLNESQDTILINVKAEDDYLRVSECNSSLFHVIPSRAMRTDALAQYLIWKKWRLWFLVSGKYSSDAAYVNAVKRSAKRFGGKIVEERSYKLETGNNRVDSGHQQIQTQMPMLTRNAKKHDVVFVADENESFGLYLPYRTAEPRPVVGTYGLVATAWHRSYEQYAGTQMQNSFEEFSGRIMTEKDYMGWLALKIIGKAVMQSKSSDIKSLKDYMISEKLSLAAYKGRPLTFRRWNQQMRQPLLISSDRALVTMAPLDEFLHPKYYTDTLGFDEKDSECKLN